MVEVTEGVITTWTVTSCDGTIANFSTTEPVTSTTSTSTTTSTTSTTTTTEPVTTSTTTISSTTTESPTTSTSTSTTTEPVITSTTTDSNVSTTTTTVCNDAIFYVYIIDGIVTVNNGEYNINDGTVSTINTCEGTTVYINIVNPITTTTTTTQVPTGYQIRFTNGSCVLNQIQDPTTSTTTTTLRQLITIIKVMFENYICRLVDTVMPSTTTTTLVQRPTTQAPTTSSTTTVTTTTTTVYSGSSTTSTTTTIYTGSSTTAPPTTSTSTSTSTTTIPPCTIVMTVVTHTSVPPEFELISASLIKNDSPDQYELTLEYKVWMGTTFADCQSATIEFKIYDEDDNLLQTVSHTFNTSSPNVWNKVVDTITDLFIFDPFLFNLNVVNGTGDGDYKEDLVVAVVATIPDGDYLTVWTDPNNVLDDITDPTPNATMLAHDVTITANFLPYLDLTVNDGVIIPGIITNVRFGRLYNWFVVTDTRNFAPAGWHVPTDAEWTTLANTLGGLTVAGGHLKEIGLTNWQTPNLGADNISGFNLLPNGCRIYVGNFQSRFEYSYNWTSIIAFAGYGKLYGALYSDPQLVLTPVLFNYGVGLRLIKDDSTNNSYMTGNDGEIYSTVKIGSQVWMSQNSKETKFRDGSNIPIITDNTTWAALTTAGMCSYNNDDSNI